MWVRVMGLYHRIIGLAALGALSACASSTSVEMLVDGQRYEGAETAMEANHAAEMAGPQRIRISTVPINTTIMGKRGIEQLTFRVKGSDEIQIAKLSVSPKTDEILEVEKGFDLRYLTGSAPEEVGVSVDVGRKTSLATAAREPRMRGTIPSAYATLVVDVVYVGGETEHLEAPLCFEGVGSDEVLVLRDPLSAVSGPRVKCQR